MTSLIASSAIVSWLIFSCNFVRVFLISSILASGAKLLLFYTALWLREDFVLPSMCKGSIQTSLRPIEALYKHNLINCIIVQIQHNKL